jgi:hypothetical protein
MIAVSWFIASLPQQISIQCKRATPAMVSGAGAGGQSFCLVFRLFGDLPNIRKSGGHIRTSVVLRDRMPAILLHKCRISRIDHSISVQIGTEVGSIDGLTETRLGLRNVRRVDRAVPVRISGQEAHWNVKVPRAVYAVDPTLMFCTSAMFVNETVTTVPLTEILPLRLPVVQPSKNPDPGRLSCVRQLPRLRDNER